MACRKCKRETPPEALYCPFCGVLLNPKRKSRKRRVRPNGAGTAFQRGKYWYAQVTIGRKPVVTDGRKRMQPIYARKGGFKTKSAALDYCKTLKAEAQNKKIEKPALTVKQVYDLWLPAHEKKVSRSTMNCYKSAWKYFEPIYVIDFADIDLDDLQECVDDCPHGRRTRENMKALAGLLMKYALPRHLTDMNYAEFLDVGDGKKSTRPAFTREHIELIHQQIGKIPHADYVYSLIYTGFRPAEFLALKKTDYTDGVLYGGAKTEAGRDRAVPVSAKIKGIIDERIAAESEYLFPKDDGTRMSTDCFRDIFYQVLADAGIQPLPTQEKPAYYTPYSARHAFANLLKDVSGSDKDKASLIGHEDYRTTKKHYQSAELNNLKSIIEQI